MFIDYSNRNKDVTGIQLSYSKVSTYLACSEKYKLQYIDKLKPQSNKFYMIFGNVIGMVVQQACLKKKDREKLTEVEKSVVDMDTFEFLDEALYYVDINKNKEYLPTSTKIQYSRNSDNNPWLLTEEDFDIFYFHFEYYPEMYKWDRATKIYPNVSVIDKEKMNLIYWLMCRRKAHKIVEEFLNGSFKNIIKVDAIEYKIENVNDEGDGLIGFVDMICDYQYPDGSIKKTIIDFKTASKRYPEDAIKQSKQLALYASITGIHNVGYIVFDKMFKMTYHKDVEQVLLGEVDTSHVEGLYNSIQIVLEGVKDNKYEKNFDACFQYGKCEFYDICKGSITKEQYIKKYEENK